MPGEPGHSGRLRACGCGQLAELGCNQCRRCQLILERTSPPKPLTDDEARQASQRRRAERDEAERRERLQQLELQRREAKQRERRERWRRLLWWRRSK